MRDFFVQKKNTCVGYVKPRRFHGSHYTILNNEGLHSKLIITQPEFNIE